MATPIAGALGCPTRGSRCAHSASPGRRAARRSSALGPSLTRRSSRRAAAARRGRPRARWTPIPAYGGALADLPFQRGEDAFADEHLAVLRGSAALGDYEKALAQVFASSSSDRVTRLAIAEAEARNLTLGDSVALLFGVAAAIHDASATSTAAKFTTHAARSISVLQCAYAGRNLTAWAGPHLGVRTARNAGATRWRPYSGLPPAFPAFFPATPPSPPPASS
eukprot:TRINITY_DN1792_c0_g1_i3.p2 TRINITY_DN1792_c0_g1~~TRINITY_DN1792_c0_g1_i3.p2  ORF type:complete len:223 (+),score=55.48 TRINITY_DN1792_c0_g1_i3:1053-1721(+)